MSLFFPLFELLRRASLFFSWLSVLEVSHMRVEGCAKGSRSKNTREVLQKEFLRVSLIEIENLLEDAVEKS